jgi:hypothetical protein
VERDHADVVDVGRARFRQRFGIGVQRRQLGVELTQQQALAVLADPDQLEGAYQSWLLRTAARSDAR